MTNLVGTEILNVTGVAQNGQLSAQSFQTTTLAIANLGGTNYSGAATTGTNYVSSTALTTPTGLSLTNILPGTYSVHGQIAGSAPATCGVKVELVGTAGLVVSAVNITGWNYNGTTLNAVTTGTVLATDLASSANAFTNVIIDGSLVVTTAGTINFQTAQNTSSTATTSISLGSYLDINLI